MLKIEKIQNSVEASMLVEGAKPSVEAKKINLKYLKGKINSQQAIENILKIYGYGVIKK